MTWKLHFSQKKKTYTKKITFFFRVLGLVFFVCSHAVPAATVSFYNCRHFIPILLYSQASSIRLRPAMLFHVCELPWVPLCCIAQYNVNLLELAVILECTLKHDYLTNHFQMHWSNGCRWNCTFLCWSVTWNISLLNETRGDVGVKARYIYQLSRIKACCLLQLRLGVSARKQRFPFTYPLESRNCSELFYDSDVGPNSIQL